MSELQRFLPEDQDLLVGLFYRTGMWISAVDDTDTSSDSEGKEEATLRNVLGTLAKTKKSALVAELASEALRQNQSWPRWSAAIDNILEDVTAAKRVLKGQATQEEFSFFSKALMLIGTAVARAYREDSDLEESKGYMAWLVEKASELTFAVKDREAQKDMNISPSEDTALNELLDTLRD